MTRRWRCIVVAMFCLLAVAGSASAAAADTWVAWNRSGLMSEPRISRGAGWILAAEKGDPANFPTQTACTKWARQYLKEYSGRGDQIERTQTGWRILKAFTGRTGAETLLSEVGCFPSSLRPPRF